MLKFKYDSDFDKEKYADAVDDAKRYAKQLVSALKLRDWRITVKFETEKEVGKGDDPNIPTLADTSTEAQYKVAHVRLFIKSMLEKRSPLEFRNTVIHEFLHIVLSPYSNAVLQVVKTSQENLLDYSEELVVTHMENLPIWSFIK